MTSDTKFKFQDKVVITKGFYKGLKGVVRSYEVFTKWFRTYVQYNIILEELSDKYGYNDNFELTLLGKELKRLTFTEDFLELQ